MRDDESEFLTLTDDEPHAGKVATGNVWKILIVDDDQDVHRATEFAMSNTPILGRPLVFLHAFSAAETISVLRSEPGIAVVLLDVVMEHDDAGLRLVHSIRNELGMAEIRIILRTGQPGYAPAIEAIRDYDINDYKTKSELSRNRLFTTLTAALRSYEQIHVLNLNRRGLHAIIDASAKLFTSSGLGDFATGVIHQIAMLLNVPPDGIAFFYAQGSDPTESTVVATAGRYSICATNTLESIADNRIAANVTSALVGCGHQFSEAAATLRFAGNAGDALIVHIDTPNRLGDVESQLLDVFGTNIAISLDNVLMFGQLKDLAYNDHLLRIPNRLAFVRAIDDALHDQRDNATVALIDIDHFSQLNDALGHSYGDRLLAEVAERLTTMFGGDGMVARVAADVFGVLTNSARISAASIRQACQKAFQIDDTEHMLSVTTGLARLIDTDGNGSNALKCANVALNRAKDNHRGDAIFYQRDMELDTRNRVRLLQDLRAAFERNRLFVVYQPQIALQNRRVVGVEALLRWRNEQGQLVPPGHFIPLAENSGLIISLGEWVLRSACIALRQLERDGLADIRMAVNVSVSQFRHPDFLRTVDTVLRECEVAPSRIELEITESVAMLDAQFMLRMIEALRERGIAIAIDDFGTGFSSLSYLERLNVNRLKIDRSFVSQMSLGASSQRIVETIVQLGHSLSLEIIAEGIETEAEAAALTAMGCHEGQGYLFSRPLELDDVAAFIRLANR